MAGNQSRKAPISVFLVAIMVTAGFATLGTLVEPAAADHDTLSVSITTTDQAVGADETMDFTVTIDTGDSQESPDCSFEWNDQVITPDGGTSCSQGPNTYTWTPPAGSATAAGPIEVTVDTMGSSDCTPAADDDCDLNGGDPKWQDDSATASTGDVLVDLNAPDTAKDNVKLIAPVPDGAITLIEDDGDFGISKLVGPGPYSIQFSSTVDESDLAAVRLYPCTEASDVGSGPHRSFSSPDDTLTGVTEANLGADTEGHRVAAGFGLEYEDVAGNTDETICFTFNVDNKGPSLTLTDTDLGFKGGDVSLINGTHFTTTDGTGNSGIRAATLSWTHEGGLEPSPSQVTADEIVTFPLGTNNLPSGEYTLTLSTEDMVGNPSPARTATLKADPEPPRLEKVVITETNSDPAVECDPLTFTEDGSGDSVPFDASSVSFCQGPYSIEVHVLEEYPEMTAGVVKDPWFKNGDGTAIDMHAQEGNYDNDLHPPDAENGVDRHIWTYNVGGSSLAGTIEFDIDLNETSTKTPPRSISSALDGDAPTIRFTPRGVPTAAFEPRDPGPHPSPPEFKIVEVQPTGSPPTCPASGALSFTKDGTTTDGAFCATGTATPTIQLLTEAGHVRGNFTDNEDDTWSVTYSKSEKIVSPLKIKVNKGQRTAISTPSTDNVIIDPDPPEVHDITTHEWTPDDLTTDGIDESGWSEVTSGRADMPAEGLYLVKVRYTSFSAQNITFRFTPSSQSGNQDQDYAAFEFPVDQVTGADSAAQSDELKVVHVAEGITVDGSTFPTGCTAPNSGETRFWGNNRECYFLIETASIGDLRAKDRSGLSSFSDGTDYDIQPIITKLETEQESSELSNPGEIKAQTPELSLGTPTLSPTPVEIGSKARIETTLSGGQESDFKITETWACIIVPDALGSPDPEDDDGFDPYMAPDLQAGQPGCLPYTNPAALTGTRAIPFEVQPTDGNDDGDRIRNFTISSIAERDKEDLDEIYLRLFFKDEFGNIVVQNYDDSGPGLTDLAIYSGQIRAPVRADASATLYDSYQNCVDNGTADACQEAHSAFQVTPRRCFQPDEDKPRSAKGVAIPELARLPDAARTSRDGENAFDRPCVRGLALQPSLETGEYGSITVPVAVQNFGTLPDDLNVRWGHQAGAEAWDVQLVDPSGTAHEDRLTVSMDGRIGDTTARERTINVRFTPHADAIGGQSRMINVTVWSDNARNPTHLDFYVEAGLLAFDQGQVRINGSEVEALTAAPDDDLSTPISLTNTGNTRVTARIDAGEPCVDRTNSFSDDEAEIIFELQTDSGTEVPSVDLDPGQTVELNLGILIGEGVPAAEDGQLYDCPVNLVNTDTGATIPFDDEEPGVEVTVIGQPQARILDLISKSGDDAEVDVTGDEITRVIRPDVAAPGSPVPISFYVENTGDTLIEPKLETSYTTKNDKFNLGGTWKTPGGTDLLASASEAFKLNVSDPEDPADIEDMMFDPTSADLSECGSEDGDSPGDGEAREVCKITVLFEPGKQPVTGDEVVFPFKLSDPQRSGSAATVDVRLVFEHVGIVEARDVPNRVLGDGDTTTVQFRALLGDGHRFDPDDSTLRATPVFQAGGPALSPCPDASVGSVADTSPAAHRAHFNVSIEGDVDGAGAPCVAREDGTYRVNLASPSSVSVELRLADENSTRLRTLHPAQLHIASSSKSLQPAISLEQGPRDEMDANGTQYVDLAFDDRLAAGSNDPRLEGVMLSRSTDQTQLEPFLRCAPEDGSAFPGASTSEDFGMGQWTWVPAGTGGSTTVPADTSGSTEEQGQLDIHGTDWGDRHGRLMTVQQDSNQQSEARDIRPTGNVDLFGWGDGSGNIEWQEGWNPIVFRIGGLPDADDADDPGSPAKADIQPEIDLRFLAQFDSDGDLDPEWNRYEWSGGDSGNDEFELKSLGNGFWSANIYLPEGFADTQAKLAEHPINDNDRDELVDAWTLRVEINSGRETVDGDDLGGDRGATAYWSLEDLNLATGVSDDEVGDNDIRPGLDLVHRGPEDDSETRNDDDRIRDVETAIRFLPGQPGPSGWETGPGLHDFDAFIRLDEADPELKNDDTHETLRLANGQTLDEPLRNHTVSQFTDARPLLTFFPTDRFGAAGDTVRLESDSSTGTYNGIIGLRDLGQDATWEMELNLLRDSGNRDSLYRMLTGTNDLHVDTTGQSASHGLPMPLCISTDILTQAGDRPIADVFEEDEFADTTRLDLRAIPGLRPDRGQFLMAPSMVSDESGLQASRHDVTESFTILGAGVIDLGEISFSSPAEVDVPTPVSVRIPDASLLASQDPVRARLALDGEVVDSTSLEPTGDGIYEGSLTGVELGEHTLTVLASDIQGGITAESLTVEVVENAPPRIQVTRPSEVEGIRAMQPGGTAEAKVTNSIIAPEHITLLEKTGGDGDGVSGSPLAESDGVNITGIQDTVAPGSFSLTVNMTDALGEHNDTDVHGWLNVTDADGAAVDSFEGDLDEDASFSGSISLDSAGTYTLRAVGNNTTAAEEVVNTTFTVTVQETGGDFSEVGSDDYNVTCETSTCTVRYAPSGLSGGQTLTLRYDVEVTADDAATNDTVIVIDDLDPSPEINIGTPSSGTTVSPSTLIEVSAGDNTLVDQLVVSGVTDDTELGSTTVTGEDGEVSVRELGLTEDGQATIRLTATDIAGNNATETQTVTVDSTGPDLSDATTGRSNGDLIVRVTAEDPAGVDDVTLFFQRPGGSSFTTSVMEAAESGDRFVATISDVGDTGAFRFYIEATDALNNEDSLGSSNSPRTVELGDVPIDTNTAPEVSITSPADGDRVSGEITVSWEVSDAEGDSVTISGVQASPAVGQAVSLTASEGEAVLDTTQLPEGGLTITVDASDGRATGSDSIQVIVDNLAPAPACEADAQAEAGEDFEVCFELETASTVTQVELQYVRNGEVVVSETLEPSEDGQYRTTVNFPEPGTYTPKVVMTHEDGTTEETTFETQSVAEALSDKPIARFVGMIVLAVAVLGVAGYAAFGRWN